jgi:Holliday junction DNA helicase RuvA
VGTIAVEELDGSFVLDVGGVGYEVVAPLGTLGRARANAVGERITLHVHTHVREDALLLYAHLGVERGAEDCAGAAVGDACR